jgi:Flp pilus assembly protein TadG
MQMPKVVYFILLSLFLLILMFDTYLYFSSVSNFRDALDQALDAAIIAGIDDLDTQHGKITIDSNRAEEAAKNCLKENLKLDAQLSNAFYSDSNFVLEINSEGTLVQGKFTTKIQLLSLKMFNLPALPYSIGKTQDYLSSYI